MKLRTHNETFQMQQSLGPKRKKFAKCSQMLQTTHTSGVCCLKLHNNCIWVWTTLSCDKAQSDPLVPSVHSSSEGQASTHREA